jgi:hypothetical protein
MMPNTQAYANFQENKKDVDQLWAIHQEYAGGGAGRKYGVEVINKAVIVFITACWESYIEDLAREAFAILLSSAPTPTALPAKIRDAVTRPIFDQKDSRKVWDLADAGWKTLMQAHGKDVLEKWIGSFNTPKTTQIDNLFLELFGMARLSLCWKWKKMPADRAASRLDDYVTMRGNIAHRTEHDAAVVKDQGVAYLNHVTLLIDHTEKATFAHLQTIIGRDPW